MKIDDLNAWAGFIQVADHRNFMKAGVALGLSPSNMTKQIASLESRLGVRLFNRTTRSVTLTQEGENLLPMARSLLEAANEIEDRALEAQALVGTIRLTCLPVVAYRWLAPELVKFRKEHPGIRFHLDLSERLVDLIGEQMDLAIRVQEPKGADFVFREIADNELVVCASPKYLKSASIPKNPKDLLQHSLLTLDLYSNCRFIKTQMRLAELNGSRAIKCETGLFLTELALRGEGIAIRSRWDVFTLLKGGALVEILSNHKIEPFGKAYVVIPQKRFLSARVRAFVDHLLENAPSLKSLTK